MWQIHLCTWYIFKPYQNQIRTQRHGQSHLAVKRGNTAHIALTFTFSHPSNTNTFQRATLICLRCNRGEIKKEALSKHAGKDVLRTCYLYRWLGSNALASCCIKGGCSKNMHICKSNNRVKGPTTDKYISRLSMCVRRAVLSINVKMLVPFLSFFLKAAMQA